MNSPSLAQDSGAAAALLQARQWLEQGDHAQAQRHAEQAWAWLEAQATPMPSLRVAWARLMADLHGRFDLPPPSPCEAPTAELHFLEMAQRLGQQCTPWNPSAQWLTRLADAWAAAGDMSRAYGYAREAVAALPPTSAGSDAQAGSTDAVAHTEPRAAAPSATERELWQLLEVVDAAVILFHGNQVVWANATGCVFTGRALSDLVGRPFLDLVYPPDYEIAGEAAYELLTGRSARVQAEYRLQRPDGSSMWLESHFSIGVWGGEQVAVGVFTDQTLRHEADEARRRADARYRSVIEHMQEAVMVWRGRRPLFVNHRACELTGYTEAELRGMAYHEFTHEEDVAKIEAWAQALKQGKSEDEVPYPEQVRVFRKNGEMRWLATNNGPCEWDGLPAQICIYQDVTERRMAELALKQSEANHRRLIQDLPAAVVLFKGNDIVFCNDRVSKFTGFDPEALKSRPFTDFVYEQDQEAVAEQAYQMMLGQKHEYQIEYRHLCGDGVYRWVDARFSRGYWESSHVVLGVFSDISERRKAQELLRESEARHRGMFESILEPVLIFQGNQVVHANRAACEFSGRSFDELVGSNYIDAIYPDDQEAVAEFTYRRILGLEKKTRTYFRFLHKRGYALWVEGSIASCEWNGKEAAVGVFLDQSQRKKAEQALQQAEERYRGVIDNVDNPICIYLNSQTVYVNKAAVRTSGFSEEELLQGTFVDFVHPDDQEGVGEWVYKRMLSQPTERSRRFKTRNKDGSYLDVEATIAWISWNGKPAAASVFTDLTERMAAEAAMKERQARIAQLLDEVSVVFEKAPLAMMMACDGNVLRANARLAELFGRDVNQVIGKPVAEILPSGRMHDLYFGEILPALQPGSTVSKEIVLESLEADDRWLLVTCAQTEMAGYQHAAITLFEDFTVRKQLENSVHQALADAMFAKERADAASRAKSEFLAMMSHEIRTPMAGVIGMQGFALRDTSLGAKTRQQLRMAQANAKSLLSIINDVLDFSKIEAGKLTIENVDFSLKSAVTDAIALLAERAADKSVLLELHLADDLPGFVVGDPTRLRQVLVNLVGNALKFTDRGSVSVGIYLVSRKGTVSQVRFDVKDSGIGMSPEALSRMFQKFEQADTSTTRRYGGTGLGLAITKQLVELMGGHIGVTSTLGVGSTFSFELPMPDGQEVQEHAELDMAPHSHRLRVLCAEDFPTNQIIIRTLLEEMGHEVHVVENGRLAVHALAQGSFDLVLMDGRMPEMDGAEATRAIRAGGLPGMAVHAVDIPIIALTANATEEDRQHYLACGMDDFLSKPIDESALHALLARQIEALLAQSVALPLRDAQPAESPPPSPSAASLDALFGVSEEGGAAGLELEATSGASQPDWGQAAELSLVAEEPSPAPAKFDLKTRMRQAFSKDLPQRWAELAAAAQRRDAAHAARLFHGFKGSVAYIEPGGVAYHLCSELEHAADHADWPRIDSQLDKLHALMQTWWPQ